jgi:UDP-N-acetylmuramoyl-tripeptide--D-alanyl-D-alanine ligase
LKLSLADVVRATGGKVEKSARSATSALPEQQITIFDMVGTDTRSDLANGLFVALAGERFDGHDYIDAAVEAGASGVLISSGPVPKGAVGIRVDDTLKALGDLARFVRRKIGMKLGAITGSFGKTTTKEMAVALARGAGLKVLSTPGNFNNLIGLPLTLLAARGDEEVAIVELGISEPGEMAKLASIAEPDVALITGVGVAHTEDLGSLGGVVEEKLLVASGLREGGTLILPAGQAFPLVPVPAPDTCRTITFGWDEGADVRGEGLTIGPDGESSFNVGGVKIATTLPGRHNAANALAAWSLVSELSAIKDADALEGALKKLGSLVAPALRGEIRTGKAGAKFFIDCYNANPTAVAAALETLKELSGGGPKVASLGRMAQLGALSREAHLEVGRVAARTGLSALLLYGEDTGWIREGALAAGMAAEAVEIFETRQELTTRLEQIVTSRHWVLIKGSRAAKLDEVADALAPARRKRRIE